MNYYTSKLAKESEVHREAFNQVVNMAFDATQEIVELGRKELEHSEKTSESLEKLQQIRKKWEDQAFKYSDPYKSKKLIEEGGH